MFDLFLEGNRYYDYPSFEVALFSLLLALVLSSVIAFTYKSTCGEDGFSKNMFQAMILSSLVTSMIMMAVGNNLAVGFGIIGAVAIIRFRTNVQNPRNIIFMFSGLSIGIATGVHGYAIAIAGTVIFCMTAVMLYYSRYRTQPQNLYVIECAIESENYLNTLKTNLNEICKTFEINEIRKRPERFDRYTFTVSLKAHVSLHELFESLQIHGLSEQKVNKKQIVDQL